MKYEKKRGKLHIRNANGSRKKLKYRKLSKSIRRLLMTKRKT